MNCQVIPVDIAQFTVLIEYIDSDGNVQRCYLSRELLNTSRKNQPVLVPCDYLSRGINYSDVDLTLTLGSYYKGIQVRDIQQVMQRAGLWLREDYRINIGGVNKLLVANNWRKFVDAQTIVNAAMRLI